MQNNKKIAKRTAIHLSKRILIKNKFKFISIIIAVIMTTILFTILYTISYSMKLSDEKSNMRRIGNTSDVTFEDLTKKQADKLKQYPKIQQYSGEAFIGVAENDELLGRITEIWFLQDEKTRMDLAVPTEGTMPVKANEIAVDTIVLDRLKIPHKLGSTITINWKRSPVSEEILTEQFILTGFWEGDEVSIASKAWVSEEFVKANVTPEQLKGNFRLNVIFKNQNKLEEKAKAMIKESGYKLDDIAFSVSWAFEDNSVSKIIFYCLCVLLIIICGYLIISNTVKITLQNDIRFYAQLKMLGVTSKQLGQIILYQIKVICCFAVPIGIGIGYFISYLLLPKLLYYYQGGYVLATHPYIFAVSAVFAIFTVVISCRKPLQIVANVSPMESFQSFAMDIKNNKKNKEIKNITLYKLAKRNFSKNKKELILSVLSVSLGIILLNSIYTIQSAFDTSKYLSGSVLGDFILSHASLYNSLYNPADGKILEKVSSDLKSMNEIKNIGEIYYRETKTQMNEKTKKMTIDFYSTKRIYKQLSKNKDWLNEFNNIKKSGEIFTQIYGMDQSVLEKLNIYKGELDWNKFQTGNYILEIGYAEQGDFNDTDKIGDKIIIEGKEYTVMGHVEMLALSRRNSSYNEAPIIKTYIIPSNEFRDRYPNDTLIQLIVDVQKGSLSNVEEKLKSYQINTMPELNIISKNTYLNAYKMEQGASTIMWKTLSLITMLIGVVNFINIRLTSGFSRKGDFLIMGKSGMTGKQLRSMLNIEGIVLIFYTGIISMISSILLSVTFIRAYVSEGWTNTYHFVITPVIILLFLLCIMSYILCWHIFKRTYNN